MRARAALLVVLAIALVPAAAFARRGGVAAEGCGGCHAGTVPMINMSFSPNPLMPGQAATITVNIQAVNGNTGGLYMYSSVGTLSPLAGEGTRAEGLGLVHSAPKAAVGGFVTFRAGWTAPATPGGVNFYVSGVSANGDNSSRGDGGGFGFLSFAYGCTGVMFYRDYDGDGVGGDLSGYTIDCAKPQYYAAIKGDCNDNDDRVKPGAVEVCNKRDDNCDGRVDENLPIVAYYTDGDGDGHGKPGGAMVMDCTPPKGYGVGNDDCDDTKATTYVGAQELCNYVDDNCNGRIDEDARVTCGLGWCRRLGSGCGSTQCTPGEPRVEECNAFDDDCDGVNDNGTDVQLCGDATKTCVQGYCVAKGSLPDGGAGGKPGTGSAGSSGSGAGPGGGALTGGTAGDPGTGGSSIERTHPGCSVVEAPSSASLSVGLVLVALALVARRRSRHSKG